LSIADRAGRHVFQQRIVEHPDDAGLVIAVGMLVDNSIVVAENIHRMHR
jgi:fructose-specific component phosphotransferase system IIB-like protein